MRYLDLKFVTTRGNLTVHEAIVNDNSKGTVLILPGLNNNSSIPILHLIRKALLDDHYNVINVDYEEVFNSCLKDTYIEELELLVQGIMNEYAKVITCKNISVISRSLGSILATELHKKKSFEIKKMAIVSPVKETIDNLENLSNIDCLVITSTKDPLLNEELISRLKGLNHLDLLLFENGNHSLEVNGDIDATLDIIRETIISMRDFIEDLHEK